MINNNKTFKICANIVLILLSLGCLIPFILLFMSSITDEGSLMRNGYSLFPQKFSFRAYSYLLTSADVIFKAYGITIFVTFVGTSLNLILTTLLAYPLSRKDLPFRNFFSFFIFFTMLFNGGLVPSYIMWTQVFHIKNSMFALIIPYLMLNAFYVIMMRTYFSSNIPFEIIEAAKVDGAREFRILLIIVVPLSKPIIATVGLMVGLMYWNDWLNGLYFLTKPEFFSIQNILNRMIQDAQFLSTNSSAGAQAGELMKNLPSISLKMAVAVVGALPVMIIYPFFQKYFVKGITVGGVKG